MKKGRVLRGPPLGEDEKKEERHATRPGGGPYPTVAGTSVAGGARQDHKRSDMHSVQLEPTDREPARRRFESGMIASNRYATMMLAWLTKVEVRRFRQDMRYTDGCL